MNLSKIFNYPLFLAFAMVVALPVSAATQSTIKASVKKVVTTVKKAPAKTAPKPAVKVAPKATAKGRQQAAGIDNPKASLSAWRGVVTGVENSKTFYLKQHYTYRLGELTIKVTPETEFFKNDNSVGIDDISGGDYVEVKGNKKGQIVTAAVVKYISSQFKNK